MQPAGVLKHLRMAAVAAALTAAHQRLAFAAHWASCRAHAPVSVDAVNNLMEHVGQDASSSKSVALQEIRATSGCVLQVVTCKCSKYRQCKPAIASHG